MADYEVFSARVYSFNAGSGTYTATQATNSYNVTISDGNPGDNMISTSDMLTQGGFAYAGYPGYLNIGGVFMPIEDIGGGTIFVYSPQTAGSDTLPASFTTADIQTDPFMVCFAAGTQIETPDGPKLVEALAIGDVIRTADGQDTSVKWVGRQTMHKMFCGPQMQPVRIRAGALGDGLPHSDLTVTGDHGMVIDGLVINASALVNGDTIDFVPMDELEDSFTVYHIETEDHDVILAYGATSETFVDAVTRSHFDNYQEYLDLYGVERIIPEMDRPRIASQRLLPETIKARLGIVESAEPILLQTAI